jgi:hypothetical protein
VSWRDSERTGAGEVIAWWISRRDIAASDTAFVSQDEVGVVEGTGGWC